MKTLPLSQVFVASLLFASGALATHHDHAHDKHREHGAHVHGSAELSVAFDGLKGKVEFKAPSDSIQGFEHVPKSEKDKKKSAEALNRFETKIAEMLVFDASLKCQFTKEKVELVAEGGTHSDTVANFNVQCEKSPVGTTVLFNIQKLFPRLKDIDAQILVDSFQKSVEIKKAGQKLELK